MTTAEQSMLDRVAIAISGAPFPTTASRRKARKAIEAMRKPSPAILDNALWRVARGRFAVEKTDAWKGLIDAILNEETVT